jgi:tetratricopeptide (TPR) repeat protein
MRNITYLGLLVAGAVLVGPVSAETLTPWWSQEVTECDHQASHGLDPFHVAPGVSRRTMNFEKAQAACEEAVRLDPENPRLNYLLGRVYGYSGQWEKAMPYRLKAVEKEYPQSLFVIGFLYFSGETIDEKNPCKTVTMWRRAAQLGRMAAQVALPRHYVRGDFDSCGVDIPKAELAEYLEAADAQTSDFYTSMLIEDLKTELGQ